MARYKLTLSYDGTDFSGSQRQAKGRTVQGELEKACRKLGWPTPRIVLAGRTDAGVHASGQVAVLDVDWRHAVERMREALNSKLPPDLAVHDVEVVPEAFHPRFGAVSRRYCYRLRCGSIRDPLHERMTWRVWPPVEESLLGDAAAPFLGKHDFGAYGSAPRRNGTTVRTVTESEWSREGHELVFTIAADGFLYRMVRRIVFVQVLVSQGRCPIEAMIRALEAGRPLKDLPAGIAPASGLTLVGVDY